MRKYIFISIAMLVAMITSCQKEELVYDHEQPQFELREGAYLLEVLVPTGTATDDEIYIYGGFNGEDAKSVTSNLQWKLEKAQYSDKKWGIYIFPEDFVEGKSLKDGFTFVSKKAGVECTIKGDTAVHVLDVALGTRTNVWAERWAAYFSTSDETVIEHDGYVIYVQDESGYANLNLYMYGDVNDLNGGWPGMKATGKQTINDVEYTYFDMGSDNTGLSETLIFNDGTKQLKDYGPITLNKDYFLHIHADGTIEEISSSSTVEHDGAVVYVLDGMGWGMATTLYMWGDVNDLNGGWPGMTVKGVSSFGAYNYMYFDMGEANAGLNQSLIFSNNGASQLDDYEYTIGDDIYLYIANGTVSKIDDPENPGDVVWFDPIAKPKEPAVIELYFYDATDTLTISVSVEGDSLRHPLNLYAWGSQELFGAWPGVAFEQMEDISILGLPLWHCTIECFIGDAYHLIVNTEKGQLADYDITVQEANSELYLKVTDHGVEPLSIVAAMPEK